MFDKNKSSIRVLVEIEINLCSHFNKRREVISKNSEKEIIYRDLYLGLGLIYHY